MVSIGNNFAAFLDQGVPAQKKPAATFNPNAYAANYAPKQPSYNYSGIYGGMNFNQQASVGAQSLANNIMGYGSGYGSYGGGYSTYQMPQSMGRSEERL